MYARKIKKNTAVPMRLCFVETGSSFGTGIKEKISMALSTRIGAGARYSWMNDSFIRDFKVALLGLSSPLIEVWEVDINKNISLIKLSIQF